jgi:hypothetical protein
VVRGTCVQEPLRGAGQLDGDAGGGEGRVKSLGVPGAADQRRRRQLRLVLGRHRLLRLKWWLWAKHTRARGVEAWTRPGQAQSMGYIRRSTGRRGCWSRVGHCFRRRCQGEERRRSRVSCPSSWSWSGCRWICLSRRRGHLIRHQTRSRPTIQ